MPWLMMVLIIANILHNGYLLYYEWLNYNHSKFELNIYG